MEKNRVLPKGYYLGEGDLVEGDPDICRQGKREGEKESKRKKVGH